MPDVDLHKLAQDIKQWGKALGFQKVGITDVDLRQHEPALQQWLDNQYHGEMDYMARHGMMRARPDELLPGTLRVISVRMDYLPPDANFAKDLNRPDIAYISRYALGRDYHKLIRNRLKKLGEQIRSEIADYQGRPFVDSAPVLERPLAEKAGLGWVGKHSLLLEKEAGSWFFLGELLINLPLPIDTPQSNQCGHCVACIKICPTNAIVEPYVVDARRCISYLTIELQGSIPEEFRSLIGNRIYGCDDCQLICPWNRYAQLTEEADFNARSQLKSQPMTALLAWDEPTFLKNTEGSPIRRIGFERWQRNLAVGLGNAPYSDALLAALEHQLSDCESDLVKEHLKWAIAQQTQKAGQLQNKTRRLIRVVEKGLPRDA